MAPMKRVSKIRVHGIDRIDHLVVRGGAIAFYVFGDVARRRALALGTGFRPAPHRPRCSYTGRNPKSGEQVTVKGKKLLFFKAGMELRRRVNQWEGGLPIKCVPAAAPKCPKFGGLKMYTF